MARAPPLPAPGLSRSNGTHERTRLMPSLYSGAVLLILALTALGLTVWLATSRGILAHAWWPGRQPHAVPLTIMVADHRRRRELERALRAALHHLQRAHGAPCPASAIVVQRLVWDGWGGEHGRQVHGCAQRPARCAADPRPRLCLALEVDGRALPLDEVLATLAELWTLPSRGDDRAFVPIVFSPAPPPQPANRLRTPVRPPASVIQTDD